MSTPFNPPPRIGEDSPNSPLPPLPRQFQKPEIPFFSVPELSMISDDLNASRLSSFQDRRNLASERANAQFATSPNFPTQEINSSGQSGAGIGSDTSPTILGVPQNPSNVQHGHQRHSRIPCQKDGFGQGGVLNATSGVSLPSGRRCSDGGASLASNSSSASSSSSCKRILPPATGPPRRNSSGQLTSQPQMSPHTARNQTETTTTTTTSIAESATPTSHGSPLGTTLPSRPSAMPPKTFAVVTSSPSSLPEHLFGAFPAHHRVRSTPSKMSQEAVHNGFDQTHAAREPRNPALSGYDENDNDNKRWPQSSALPSSRPQQQSRPSHEFLNGGDPPEEDMRKEVRPPLSAALDLDFSENDVRGSWNGASFEGTDASRRQQHQSHRQEQPRDQYRSERRDRVNGVVGNENAFRRSDDVHPVVMEMLRMQEANIRLLQEQVMFLMQRVSNEDSKCRCDHHRSVSRRCCGGDGAERRDVGVNVATSFQSEAETTTTPKQSSANDSRQIEESPLKADARKRKEDDRSSSSRSNHSQDAPRQHSPSVSSTPSSRGASRPPSQPSAAASRASSSGSDRKFSGVRSPVASSPSKPSSPARPPEDSSPSTTTRDARSPRGDFSQLSSPRFGESAAMITHERQSLSCEDEKPRSEDSMSGRSDGISSLNSESSTTELDRASLRRQRNDDVAAIDSARQLRLASIDDEANRRHETPRHSGSVKDNADGLNPNDTPRVSNSIRQQETPESVPHRSFAQDSHNDDEVMNAPAVENMTSVFLPKINYVTLMLNRETESSAHIESLALKYLKDDELAEMAGLSPRSGKNPSNEGLHEPKGDGGGDDIEDERKNKNNFSFATKKYLMKYGLMNERSVSFVIPHDKDGGDRPRERDVGSVSNEEVRNADARSTSSSSPSPFGRRPTMVLDIHKIKHLPNLT